jgi:hypothetical protein
VGLLLVDDRSQLGNEQVARPHQLVVRTGVVEVEHGDRLPVITRDSVDYRG